MKSQDLERQIRAQRRGVIADAIAHLRGLAGDDLAAVLGRALVPLGLTEVTRRAESDEEVEFHADLLVGSSRLGVLIAFRRQRAVVDARVLEAFRERVASGFALGILIATTRGTQEAVEAGQNGSPSVAVIDSASLAALLEQAGVLLEAADVPAPLRLRALRREPPPAARASTETDRRGRAPRLFRWRLETSEDGAFSLYADYLPDPARSFVVNGRRVAADDDFVPARTALHQAICQHLRAIFPELSPARVRTKAWPGVHRVYTVREYGEAAKERR